MFQILADFIEKENGGLDAEGWSADSIVDWSPERTWTESDYIFEGEKTYTTNRKFSSPEAEAKYDSAVQKAREAEKRQTEELNQNSKAIIDLSPYFWT